jgi:hypothetical protein
VSINILPVRLAKHCSISSLETGGVLLASLFLICGEMSNDMNVSGILAQRVMPALYIQSEKIKAQNRVE